MSETGNEKKTVVCIEDQLEMINLIKFILERHSFEVIGALSGQQGLEIARSVEPDVVLLDMMMPDMDGWEVVGHLRGDDSLEDVPIIAVSAIRPSNHNGRKLPVDDYIIKPFKPDELLQRINSVIRVLV